MTILRTILHEAFSPAATLLIALTVAELVEPGFTAGVVNMPLFTLSVVALGVIRVALDRNKMNT